MAEEHLQIAVIDVVGVVGGAGVDEPLELALEAEAVDIHLHVAGYLARRYKLPTSPIEAPAMLRKLTADIAIYNVFSRKGFDFSEEVKDHIIVRRYRDAIEYLKAVAGDEADIDGLEEEKEADDDDGDGNYGGAHIWLYRS